MNARLYSILLALAPLFATQAFGGQEQVIYSFQGGRDGANPYGGVMFDAAGNLYATTELGGLLNEGTVFQLSPSATTWKETQLFNFRIKCTTGGICQSGTGNLPMSKLALDAKGNLYSTTYEGGKYGVGTVFQLAPPASAGGAWTEHVLHNFHEDGADGGIPLGGVIVDQRGRLYGTTGGGGPGGPVGCGVVFSLTPPASGSTAWTEQILHAFQCAPDGQEPRGELIRDPSGNFYGTTDSGGTGNCFSGCGTVYQLSPPKSPGGSWTETVLYSFLNTPDGVGPYGGLVRDAAGNLYGTTYRGGSNPAGCFGVGCGTVFELSPPAAAGGAWTETVLYSFTGMADGGVPLAGLAMDRSGILYGTTDEGGASGCNCGVIFQLAQSAAGGWTETVLHTFTGAPDGSYPQAGVTLHNGALYGTTMQGGARQQGVVFQVVP